MKTSSIVSVVFGWWLTCAAASAQITSPAEVSTIDPGHNTPLTGDGPGHLYAEIETSKGLIEAELDFVHAPLTVMNFVGLAEGTMPFQNRPTGTPFYDGTTFHRVVKDFVIQGGDPLSADPAFPVEKLGDGGPGYKFPDEFSPSLRHDVAGVLSMANDGPDTNGSQFFITLREVNRLNYLHSVFGQVVRGMDVVNQIEPGDKILHVTIRRPDAKHPASIPATSDTTPSMTSEKPAEVGNEKGKPDEEMTARDASSFHASEAAFQALVKQVLASRHAGPPEGFAPLVDDTKQLPEVRVNNFNYKLANYQRTTGHRIVLRLLPEFKPVTPEQSVGNAVRLLAETLQVPDTGDNVLTCYFTAGDTWNERFGEATYPALLGQSGTTDQLMANGTMHQGKIALLKSAQELTRAGKLKEGVDAVIDTLILKLDDYTLKHPTAEK